MKILILGGTRFLGPATVEYALERGHEITLFNRGKTNADMFPKLEKLRGDRNGKLEALEGDRRWDAIIDPSASVPHWVELSANLLRDRASMYVYISSISAYKDFARQGIDEDYATGEFAGPKSIPKSPQEITGDNYGPSKAACERAAEAAFPGRTANVRPGLIVGPRDNTDRFTYWPVRVDRGGEILCPGDKNAPVQVIDVRDLGMFLIRLIEDGHPGVYNATGPEHAVTMQEVVHGCKIVAASDARFTWVDEAFLLEKELGPWMEMPLWLPGSEYAGLAQVSIQRALSHGLELRPLAETIRATIDWHKTRPKDYEWRAGLAADKEAAILAAWHARDKNVQPAKS